MRFLRNPYIVGILAVLAVGLVFYQIFRPQWNRFRSRVETGAARAVDTTAKPSAPVGATVEKAKPAPGAGTVFAPPSRVEGQETGGSVDREYVRQNFPEWVDSPARDPFLGGLEGGAFKSLEPEGPSPVQSWKLTGILRQTGGRVAAINGGIYTEGMEIEGWRIERIEADQVVFRGTNRIERLVIFRQFQGVAPGVAPGPAPATNAPATPSGPITVKKLGKARPMQEHTVSPEPNL